MTQVPFPNDTQTVARAAGQQRLRRPGNRKRGPPPVQGMAIPYPEPAPDGEQKASVANDGDVTKKDSKDGDAGQTATPGAVAPQPVQVFIINSEQKPSYGSIDRPVTSQTSSRRRGAAHARGTDPVAGMSDDWEQFEEEGTVICGGWDGVGVAVYLSLVVNFSSCNRIMKPLAILFYCYTK